MNGEIKRSEPTDDYDVMQRVGNGTYGEVFKARHVRTGEYAAVKVVRLEAGENFAVIQQEIAVLKECAHPNIISYYGSYLRRDRLWIVMEYCGGGSLQDIYQSKIHRDVKGANILLTNKGDVKLADFGVAAQISATLSKRKSLIGSPYWMAPEVVNVHNQGGYGSECDVWAVGITAIELAERQPPLYEMPPMQVLYVMTKTNYRPPRLREKHKWSCEFHEFVKSCLIKNPKKRPSPEKLLTSNAFVSGALSSRLTRDLLDRVNNDKRRRSSSIDPSTALFISKQFDELEEHELKPSALITDLNIDCPSDQGINRLNAVRSSISEKIKEEVEDEAGTLTVSYSNENEMSTGNSKSDASNRIKFRSNRSMSLGSRFHMAASAMRSPFNAMIAMKRRQDFLHSSSSQPILNFLMDSTSYFGILPTPQVSMGACFLTVLPDCPLKTNHCVVWTSPASQKQLLIIGADEGIYTLDLCNLACDDSLIQIHDRRCAWLYIIGDTLLALQGKTPYLYQHDILQLVQKEYFSQKLAKMINRLPDSTKPRLFTSTIRIPETRDCYQCVVEKSVINGSLYMCCAVPNALLLFQWYEPQLRFLFIKRVEIDRLCTIFNPVRNGTPEPYKTFSLITVSSASNSDFPMACVGVSENSDNHFSEDNVFEEHLQTKSNIELKNDRKFHLHIIDFNDGRLGNADFINSQCYGDGGCDPRLCRTQSKHLLENNFSGNLSLCQENTRMPLNSVVALKQLDRDTLFIAYDDKVVLTDMDGFQKQTTLMRTYFYFEFRLNYAMPLADSVLVFHDHGVQARSFLLGGITQDLNDYSKDYKLVGYDSLIIIERADTLSRTRSDSVEETCSSKNSVDLCLLTGHISTLSNT